MFLNINIFLIDNIGIIDCSNKVKNWFFLQNSLILNRIKLKF